MPYTKGVVRGKFGKKLDKAFNASALADENYSCVSWAFILCIHINIKSVINVHFSNYKQFKSIFNPRIFQILSGKHLLLISETFTANQQDIHCFKQRIFADSQLYTLGWLNQRIYAANQRNFADLDLESEHSKLSIVSNYKSFELQIRQLISIYHKISYQFSLT